MKLYLDDNFFRYIIKHNDGHIDTFSHLNIEQFLFPPRKLNIKFKDDFLDNTEYIGEFNSMEELIELIPEEFL